jgi:hypothetical protein
MELIEMNLKKKEGRKERRSFKPLIKLIKKNLLPELNCTYVEENY